MELLMHLKLQRKYLPDRTEGELLTEDGKHISYSLELPWLSNRKSISCVPAGTYALRLVKSARFGMQWHLENVDLGVSVDGNTTRTHVLIHAGNWVKDTNGCILLGLVKGMGAVHESKAAIRKLHELLGEDSHTLEILV